MNETRMLRRALGQPFADVEAWRRRLGALGGLHGLYVAGAESAADLLDPPTRERLDAIFDLVEALARPPELPDTIERPEDVLAYLAPRVRHCPAESFWIVLLDARGRPTGCHEVARGTLTACLVHPREVFGVAIRGRAATVIAVHNHPSGEPEPSADDHALTERLDTAGAILGIPVVDHLVVARGGFRSLGGMPAGEVGPARAAG